MNPSPKKWENAYAAYTRVSTAKQGERGVSLQEQKDAITRYAARANLLIAEWFEERETAAKHGRPIFSLLVRQLKKAAFSGVLIHKIDRSARNLRDWAELGQLIDQGIEVHFCHESLDLHSRGGRLSADIQAVVAADFIRNLRDETRKGIRGRLKQGLYPFYAPIGYLNCGGGNPKEPDPVKAPFIRWAFERYATGSVSLRQLLLELTERGLRNSSDGPLTLHGLSTILNNPFYTGRIRIYRTGEMFMGVHEPLISVRLFEKAQAIMRDRRQHVGLRHDFLFRRMFRCRLCGKALIGELAKGHTYYRCHTRGCPTTCVREELLEREIMRHLGSVHLTDRELSELEEEVAMFRNSWTDDRQKEVAALNLKLGQTQQRLDRLTDAYVDGLIDRETFTQRKAGLVKDQRVSQEKRDAPLENSASIANRLEKFLQLSKTAYLSYTKGNLFQKREVLEMVTSNRWVEQKNVVVELQFPFFELAKWRAVPFGALERYAARTFSDPPLGKTPTEVPDVPEVPDSDRRAQAAALIRTLAQLPPEEFPRI